MRFNDIFRTSYRISAKVAIYSDDHEAVLVMQYPHAHGLPGGHIEKGELPEEALRRELMEELGIGIGAVQRQDFFFRNEKRRSLIVAFVSIASKELTLLPPRPDREKGIWLTKAELAELPTISPAYKEFTLANWPV
jgi:8-oxo-dGTP pyrophosphatase MutT (NUDIX family)